MMLSYTQPVVRLESDASGSWGCGASQMPPVEMGGAISGMGNCIKGIAPNFVCSGCLGFGLGMETS